MRKLLLVLGLYSFLNATETRANSIIQEYNDFGNANYLLDDEFIIKFYPSVLFVFPNHISLEANRNGNYAYGTVFFRNERIGVGAFVSRRFHYSYNYQNYSDEFTFTPLDIVFGLKFNKILLGLNFNYSSIGNDSFLVGFGDSLRNNLLGFTPSFSYLISENSGLNFSYLVLNNSYSRIRNNLLYSAKYSTNAILMRFYRGSIILPIIYGSTSFSINAPDGGIDPDSESVSNLLKIGLGLNKKIQDLGFFIFAIQYENIKIKSQDNNTNSNLEDNVNILGFVSGVEAKFLASWLIVRGGISYNISLTRQSQYKYPDTKVYYNRIGAFGDISFGLGISTEIFKVDFDFTEDLFYNGPQFISGNGLGFNMSILANF